MAGQQLGSTPGQVALIGGQLPGAFTGTELEEGLRRSFPLDVIEEVKKGQRGGDVIQRVQSRSGAAAGVSAARPRSAASKELRSARQRRSR